MQISLEFFSFSREEMTMERRFQWDYFQVTICSSELKFNLAAKRIVEQSLNDVIIGFIQNNAKLKQSLGGNESKTEQKLSCVKLQ